MSLPDEPGGREPVLNPGALDEQKPGDGAFPPCSSQLDTRPLTPEEREWLVTELDLRFLRSRGLTLASFEPWRAGRTSIKHLLDLYPHVDKLLLDDDRAQMYVKQLETEPFPKVILLQEKNGQVSVFYGHHALKLLKTVFGEDRHVDFVIGFNASVHPAFELYRSRKMYRANEVLFDLEKLLATFTRRLDKQYREEFEGLQSVLCTYVHFDLRSGTVNYGLMNLLIANILSEVERLVGVGVPFPQEICGTLAQGYEEIGIIHDDLALVSGDKNERNLALLCYELANIWYRVTQQIHTGLFLVNAQLHIVKNMIRLGSLTNNRGILRRAIRELFILLDTDKFKDEYLALVSLRGNGAALSSDEQEDLIHGFLDTRRRFRVDVRKLMIEAITRLHASIPESTRHAFRALERDIIADQESGTPSALLHFLRANLTAISELENVKGGRDFMVRDDRGVRYTDMLEHVEEVTRALEALESGAKGLEKITAASRLAGEGRRQDAELLSTEGAELVRDGTRYFYDRLTAGSRRRTRFEEFAPLFQDVVEDYRSFARHNPVSKINFWMGVILHDIGTILLEQHHVGGRKLVASLLDSLQFSPSRKASILSYIENHGEFKRFYLLEKSPRDLLNFMRNSQKEGCLPYMLLEKRRIESIIDLAATGSGRLTTKFLRITRKNKSIEAIETVANRFGTLRRSVWGLEGVDDLYSREIDPGERRNFFDEYFDTMRIVYYDNLRKELSPQTLLNFHYICARTAYMSGRPVDTVMLNSDRSEHLQALQRALQGYQVHDIRVQLTDVQAAMERWPPETRATRLLSELRSRFGLIVEFKGDQTISVNTRFLHQVEQRQQDRTQPRRPH